MKISISFAVVFISLVVLFIVFWAIRKLNWRSALMLLSCATVLWLSMELRTYLSTLLDGDIEIFVDLILIGASFWLMLPIYSLFYKSVPKDVIPHDK